jgi:hypothetical protein
MNSSEIAPPQVYVRCNFCAQSLGHSLVIQNARNREGKRMNVQTSNPGGRASGKQKVTRESQVKNKNKLTFDYLGYRVQCVQAVENRYHVVLYVYCIWVHLLIN